MTSSQRVLTQLPMKNLAANVVDNLLKNHGYKKPYEQNCLKGGYNSYKFLDECTYKVDLQKLYELKSTCYYNSTMPFCPVLVRVADDLQKYYDGFKYLLQVWDEKQELVFEVKLNQEVRVWNIFYEYLIYKPATPDKDHEYFHIVNLVNLSQCLLKDFTRGDQTYKHVCFDNKVFYVANSNQIKLYPIDYDFDEIEGEQVIENIEDSLLKTIVPDGHKIHGLFTFEDISSSQWLEMANKKKVEVPSILVALETSDNQIDLNMLCLTEIPGHEAFSYVFLQYRPLVPRQNTQFDAIEKYHLIFNGDNIAIGAARKKSGSVDYYYDGMLCMAQSASAKGADSFTIELEVSFDETFFTSTSLNQELGQRAVTKAVNHELKARMSSSEARELPDYKIKNVFYQKVKKHCKVFQGFVFLKTYIFVAHGRLLSLYDMKTLRFTKHMQFDRDVSEVFRTKRPGTEDGEFDVCVLLQNANEFEGQIKIINLQKSSGKEDEYAVDEALTIRLDGQVLQFDQDRDENEFTFMLMKLPNDYYKLSCLHGENIYDLTDSFKDQGGNPLELNEETNFVFFFSPKDITEVLVHQGEWFFVNEIHYNEEKDEITIEPQEKGRNKWVDLSLPISKQQEMDLVVNDLHSAIRVDTKDDKNTLMIFACEQYFYVINMNGENHNPARFEQRCAGLFISDNNYMYTLTHKNPEMGIQSGFRLYDIENCISKAAKKEIAYYELSKMAPGDESARHDQLVALASQDVFMSYHLQSVQVGCQGLIDFSHQNQRLVYQSSYDFIEVVPMLHRNTIAFVGMSNREEYLVTKVIKDRFIALDKRNQLTSWDIVTGKIIDTCAPQFAGQSAPHKGQVDYSQYEIYTFDKTHYAYHQDWAHRVLLKSKQPYPDSIDEATFYDPSMIKSSMRHQINFIKSLHKVFYEFKLVEITSDKEVKEHLSFVFPHYEAPLEKKPDKKIDESDSEEGNEKKPEAEIKVKQMQHLFFSEDMQLMLEQLSNARVFLYKRVHMRDRNNESRVRWELVHRFTQFPTDLAEITQYPYIFSPDFTMYLDVDRKNKQFLIRDSRSQEVKVEIPDTIMSCKEEPIKTAASRFTWASNDSLRIINSVGIERRIALVENKNTKEINFKEEKYCVVQLFDKLQWVYDQTKNHMYFDKCQVGVADTLNRLLLKYFNFRQAYYLEGKREKELYPYLFTVDYGVSQYKGRYFSDLSFTFLHWNLMEKLHSGRITVDQIDDNQFQKLVYNILPLCETVFHRLADAGQRLFEVMDVCHPNKDKKPIPAVRVHMPFIENFAGESLLDILCKKSDFRTANLALQFLAAYDIDHHSRSVVMNLPLCVTKQLPNVLLYLDSRLRQTKKCLELNKGNLIPTMDPPGVTVASFSLSDESQAIIKRAAVESDLKLEFLDVPILHQFDEEICDEFFEAVAETKDMRVFTNKGIKMLINFRWPLAREFIVKFLFLPFLIFLFTFVLYMGTIFDWRQDPDPFYRGMNDIFMIIMLTEAAYFISIEIYQLYKNGLSYFTSVWNYLDLIPPILLFVFIPLAIQGTFDSIDGVKQNQTLEASLQATMSLTLWLKFLYFLRIFESFGYLIKIIISVCAEMRYFLLILLLTIMAFGDSLRQISTSNLPQHEFIDAWWKCFTYVYRMILGDFNTEPTVLQGGPILLPEGEDYTDPNNGFGIVAPYYTWTIFYLCTVLNMIIMLNLLIAIISESFARINAEKEQASYQEKCKIISENSYLIPKQRKEAFCQRDRYLLIATDIQQELDSQTKDSAFLLKETHRKINESTVKLEDKVIQEIEKLTSDNKNLISSKMENIVKENEKILKLIEQSRD